jgi:hypothetical protein
MVTTPTPKIATKLEGPSWVRHIAWFFPLLLVFGLLDRSILLVEFGFQYVGDDDGVIWAATTDYANGEFHEPYFYGQDYNPMLEALLGALFVKIGCPHWVVMPVITSLLALLPFWSFGLWHYQRREHAMACLCAAMPILLPVEYGMITTITRGFVTGVAILSFFPWTLGIVHDRWRNVLIGLVLSAAVFFNPNASVLAIAFASEQFLRSDRRITFLLSALAGAIPMLLAYGAARAYYLSRPDTLVHTLYDWRSVFHVEGIPEGLGKLDLLFSWLFPVAWQWGQLAFYTLLLLTLLLYSKKRFSMAIGATLSVLLILFSFGFAKTHDGEFNVFYPAARMFLAMPLLLLWALSGLVTFVRHQSRVIVSAMALSMGCMTYKAWLTPATVAQQVTHVTGQVMEMPRARLQKDKDRIVALCEEHGIDALIIMEHRQPWENIYRCYLYGAIDDRMPPTYHYPRDRRYWRREAISAAILPDLMIVGSDPGAWGSVRNVVGDITALNDPVSGPLIIVHGNTLPTDSLIAKVRSQTVH